MNALNKENNTINLRILIKLFKFIRHGNQCIFQILFQNISTLLKERIKVYDSHI